MVKRLRLLIIISVLVGLVLPMRGGNSAVSLEPNPAALDPWKIETVVSGVETNSVAVAFGGSYQYPLISYGNQSGYTRLVMPAASSPGNCGSGNRWKCWDLVENYVEAGTTGPMAVYNFQNSFKIGWGYQNWSTGNTVLIEREYSDSLDPLSTTITKVVDPDLFAGENQEWGLVGVPSLEYDEYGNAHFALVLGFGGMRKLIYAYEKTGTAPTTPCNEDSNTHFQCDVILETSSPLFILTPYRLILTASGKPRIAYYTLENSTTTRLMYAYPYSSILFPHTNCGPGGDTWRCIVMLSSSGTWTLGGDDELPMVDMAIAPGNEYPRLAIRAEDSEGRKYVVEAEYVGSDGSCGSDWNLSTFTNRWLCDGHFIDSRPTYPYTSFGIAADAYDYPVLAVGHAHYLDYIHLWLTYPEDRLRTGNPGAWVWEKLDGRDIDTAYAIDFALSSSGLGLIGYVEKEEYNNKLKIAYQQKITNLPVIIR